MPRVILLQGLAGSGKTWTACRTALKRPVTLIDIDRKAHSVEWLVPMIVSGDVVVYDIGERMVEGSLRARALALIKNDKPTQPKGWVKFAEIIEDIFYQKARERDKRLKAGASRDEALKGLMSGTLVIDSWTFLMPHMKAFIVHNDDHGHATLHDRNWGTFLTLNTETIDALKDFCAEWDMDLIVTVHEKISDIPNRHTVVRRVKDEKGQNRRQFEGPMDALIAPSIEGQFGNLMPGQFAEVYQTFVDDDNPEKPTWRMRIKPDGLRLLRTGRITTDIVVEPDLSKLWSQSSEEVAKV